MDLKYLKTRQDGATLWVEIHNPPVNFLTTDIVGELFELVKKIRKDNSIRVFILTGGIEDTYIMHFSIPELYQLVSHNRRLLMNLAVKFRPTAALLKSYMTSINWLMDCFSWYEWLQLKLAKLIRKFSSGMFLWLQMMRLYHAIERMNKVTIAAINGPCNGGGTELSACFDFRFMVAGQGYTMGQPECLVGIVPGGGSTQRLPRLIGRAKALELMLRGNQLTPEEAKEIGLITNYYKKKVFVKKVQEFADLMSKRPPVAIDAIKKCVLQGMNTSLRSGLSIELTQSLRCIDTKDAQMAMEKYSQYLEDNIYLPLDKRPKPEEVMDIMENAKIFEEFEGK